MGATLLEPVEGRRETHRIAGVTGVSRAGLTEATPLGRDGRDRRYNQNLWITDLSMGAAYLAS